MEERCTAREGEEVVSLRLEWILKSKEKAELGADLGNQKRNSSRFTQPKGTKLEWMLGNTEWAPEMSRDKSGTSSGAS